MEWWYDNLVILYINLDSRKDRKTHVIQELNKLNINLPSNRHRFPAIKAKKNEHKALGCTQSHIAALSIAINNNWPYVLICEDDITFTNPELFKKQFFAFIAEGHDWEVILIAGNNFQPYEPLPSGNAIVIHNCQTTTGYLVRNSYYTTLLENFKEGCTLLKNNKNKYSSYAIDKWWFSLQAKKTWYLIIPLTIIQKEGYSDILCKNTSYTKDMLSLS